MESTLKNCPENPKHIQVAREFFDHILNFEFEEVNGILFELKNLSVSLRENRIKELSAELERIKETLDALQGY
jgi:hypothetical protein